MRSIFWLVLVASSISLVSQNVDVTRNPVAYDYMYRGVLQGKYSLSAASVFPMSVQRILSLPESSEFYTYLQEYYSDVLPNGVEQTQFFGEDSLGRIRVARYKDSTTALCADIFAEALFGRVSDDVYQNESFNISKLSFRAQGRLNSWLSIFLDMSNGVRGGAASSIINRTDRELVRSFKFSDPNAEQRFIDRYIGYMLVESGGLSLRFGRDFLQMGNSPIDNLLHSRYSAPLDGLFMDYTYKRFRFTFQHGAAEGTNSLIVTNGLEKAISSKYLASHRVSVDATDWLSLAVYDAISYSERGIDFTYLNPLAFYVSAGLGTKGKSDFDNSLLGADVSIRPFANTMLYASLLADDISFSTLSDTSNAGNNNKYAYQLGVSTLLAQPLMLSAEYVRVTPFTYSHRNINNSWTHFNQPVGYDINPNSDRIALQAKYWFTPRTTITLDADYTRHGENILDSTGKILSQTLSNGVIIPIGNVGAETIRGDGDFLTANTFLEGRISYQRRVSLIFTAEWLRNIYTDIKAMYLSRNGGNSPQDSETWVTFSLRVGY